MQSSLLQKTAWKNSDFLVLSHPFCPLRQSVLEHLYKVRQDKCFSVNLLVSCRKNITILSLRWRIYSFLPVVQVYALGLQARFHRQLHCPHRPFSISSHRPSWKLSPPQQKVFPIQCLGEIRPDWEVQEASVGSPGWIRNGMKRRIGEGC